ncbi:hypothetical protein Y032_0066g3732 [Ancylostoma ceylanicum]|nr:hypothetical protein Y032_0066g3732 [Ancylostoma ceylanicum]
MLEKARLRESKVLQDAIGKVLNDKKYKKAAHRIRDLLAKRPFTPQEKLVKTVELAAEFGQLPEFKVAGRNLGLIVYYNIDIILVVQANDFSCENQNSVKFEFSIAKFF